MTIFWFIVLISILIGGCFFLINEGWLGDFRQDIVLWIIFASILIGASITLFTVSYNGKPKIVAGYFMSGGLLLLFFLLIRLAFYNAYSDENRLAREEKRKNKSYVEKSIDALQFTERETKTSSPVTRAETLAAKPSAADLWTRMFYDPETYNIVALHDDAKALALMSVDTQQIRWEVKTIAANGDHTFRRSDMFEKNKASVPPFPFEYQDRWTVADPERGMLYKPNVYTFRNTSSTEQVVTLSVMTQTLPKKGLRWPSIFETKPTMMSRKDFEDELQNLHNDGHVLAWITLKLLPKQTVDVALEDLIASELIPETPTFKFAVNADKTKVEHGASSVTFVNPSDWAQQICYVVGRRK